LTVSEKAIRKALTFAYEMLLLRIRIILNLMGNMVRLKKSDLREKILQLVKSTEKHPTAAWVFDEVRREFPKAAVGSVYRNLSILVSEGLIKRITFDEPNDRYDHNLTEHYHFICEKCGSIYDLKVPVNKSIEKSVMEQTDFEINHHRIDFYGRCGNCRK
jgi:Fur family transcriptional regulator, peroxide stress response regulator